MDEGRELFSFYIYMLIVFRFLAGESECCLYQSLQTEFESLLSPIRAHSRLRFKVPGL